MRYRKTAPVSATLWLPGFDPNEQPTAHGTAAVADTAVAVAPSNPPETAAMTLPLFDSGIVVKRIGAAPAPKAIWPRLATDAHEALGGEVAKFDANLAARHRTPAAVWVTQPGPCLCRFTFVIGANHGMRI